MAPLLKSPLKWYGGKGKLVKKLIPLIPAHKTYVEVFAGSAALFFAKDTSPIEVVNDLHSGVVNFYRVIRDPEAFGRFEHRVSLTPYSREEFYFCRDTWASCDDPVEKAYRWFIVIRQSYSAVGKSFGYSVTHGNKGMPGDVSAMLSAIQRLPEIHSRIRGVLVEHLDFRELIAKYDRPTTFFYLDPPYVLSTRTGKVYDHEMSNDDHEELVDTLLNLQGTAMLSGYANPIYERLEDNGWVRHDFKATCRAANNSYRVNETKKADRQKALGRVESVWLPASAAVNRNTETGDPISVAA